MGIMSESGKFAAFKHNTPLINKILPNEFPVYFESWRFFQGGGAPRIKRYPARVAAMETKRDEDKVPTIFYRTEYLDGNVIRRVTGFEQSDYQNIDGDLVLQVLQINEFVCYPMRWDGGRLTAKVVAVNPDSGQMLYDDKGKPVYTGQVLVFDSNRLIDAETNKWEIVPLGEARKVHNVVNTVSRLVANSINQNQALKDFLQQWGPVIGPILMGICFLGGAIMFGDKIYAGLHDSGAQFDSGAQANLQAAQLNAQVAKSMGYNVTYSGPTPPPAANAQGLTLPILGKVG